MFRKTISAFVLCLTASVSLAGGTWTKHKLDDGRFEVLLPEPARYQPVNVEGRTMHRFTADSGLTILAASRTDLPKPAKPGKDVPAKIYFDAYQNGVAQFLDGRIVESKDIKLGNVPGREYLVAFDGLDGNPRLTRTRLFLDGLTNYEVTASGPANAIRNDGAAEKFLDSFQLPGQKAEPGKAEPGKAEPGKAEPDKVAPQGVAKKLDLQFTNQLDGDDERDTARPRSFRKVFPVELEADKTYRIDLKSRDFDTYLRLEDNTGRQVAFNDDANGKLDSQIVYTPPQGGKYRVVATTYRDGATGAFTLAVVERGPVVAGPFQAVPIPLAKNQAGGASIQSNLNFNDAIQGNFFYKVYTFPMTAGQTYRIDMKAAQLDDFDSYLFLEDPQGRRLAMNDDDPRFLTLDASILHTANKTGNYRIIATTFRAFATGAFHLQVKPLANGNGNAAMPAAKPAMPAKAAPPVLGVWEVKGRDTKTWTATMVLRQPKVGVLDGYFDWRSSGGESGGREWFRGSFNPDTGVVVLQGIRLENARGIALGRCVAVVSADGREMREGVWGGPFAQSGTWSAVLKQSDQAQAAAGTPAP